MMKGKPKRSHQTAFRLDEQMLADLRAMADEQEDRSVGYIIRRAVEKEIERWKQDKLKRESGTQDDPATAARKLLDILENAHREVEKSAAAASSGIDQKDNTTSSTVESGQPQAHNRKPEAKDERRSGISQKVAGSGHARRTRRT